MGANLSEFSSSEITEAISGRKNFKTTAKSVGRQALRKYLGSGSRRKTGSRIIPTKSAEKPVGRKETFLQTILNVHVE